MMNEMIANIGLKHSKTAHEGGGEDPKCHFGAVLDTQAIAKRAGFRVKTVVESKQMGTAVADE